MMNVTFTLLTSQELFHVWPQNADSSAIYPPVPARALVPEPLGNLVRRRVRPGVDAALCVLGPATPYFEYV